MEEDYKLFITAKVKNGQEYERLQMEQSCLFGASLIEQIKCVDNH